MARACSRELLSHICEPPGWCMRAAAPEVDGPMGGLIMLGNLLCACVHAKVALSPLCASQLRALAESWPPLELAAPPPPLGPALPLEPSAPLEPPPPPLELPPPLEPPPPTPLLHQPQGSRGAGGTGRVRRWQEAAEDTGDRGPARLAYAERRTRLLAPAPRSRAVPRWGRGSTPERGGHRVLRRQRRRWKHRRSIRVRLPSRPAICAIISDDNPAACAFAFAAAALRPLGA